MIRLATAFAAILLGSACTQTPPASWARGGAALDVPNARWINGVATIIVTPNGNVFRDGELDLRVDRAGRVFDLDNRPVAILETTGEVYGPDDEELGQVGAMSAGLPDEPYAWLSVSPDGEVIRFDEDGVRKNFGLWQGCGASLRTMTTCVLLTHIYTMRFRESTPRGPSVGIGIGIGVGTSFGP